MAPPEGVHLILAFPLRGTSARYQNSIDAAKECAERSGRMVRAPAVTEPPVISSEARNPPGRTRSFLGIPPLTSFGRDDRKAYTRSG